jgi:hypothetical protein
LVLVAEQDQARVGPQCLQQEAIISTSTIEASSTTTRSRQRMAGMMTEMTAVGTGAEQTVQGGDLGRDLAAHRFGPHRQAGHMTGDGFVETGGGLAGGRGETDPQRRLTGIEGQSL